MDGISETYLIVHLANENGEEIKVWIYEDECMLAFYDKSYYFEHCDFDLQSNLISAFFLAL